MQKMNPADRVSLPATLPGLHGTRIALRAMQASDAPALLDIYGDPLVMACTDEDPFPSLDTVGLMLSSVHALLARAEALEWALVCKDDANGTVIGTCGLHSFDRLTRAAEVGCLLRRSAWGNGYMAEAIGLMTAYARDVLKLTRLIADVAPENHRAQCLFKKLGYRQERPDQWSMELPASY